MARINYRDFIEDVDYSLSKDEAAVLLDYEVVYIEESGTTRHQYTTLKEALVQMDRYTDYGMNPRKDIGIVFKQAGKLVRTVAKGAWIFPNDSIYMDPTEF